MAKIRKEMQSLQADLHEAVNTFVEASTPQIRIVRFKRIEDIASAIILMRTARDSFLLNPEQKNYLLVTLLEGLKYGKETAVRHLNETINDITFKIGRPSRGRENDGHGR